MLSLLIEFKKKLHLGQKILLKVRVHPKSGKQQLKAIMTDGTIKIDLKSAPEDNKANQELTKLLSKFFEVKSNNITILSGKTSRTKLIAIQFTTP